MREKKSIMTATAVVISLSATFVFIAAGRAMADDQASPQGGVSPCDFQAQLRELKALETESGLSDAQKTDSELKIRKTILSNIAECDLKNATNLKIALINISSNDPAVKTLASQFFAVIEASTRDYETEKSEIGTITSIDGIKKLAGDLKNWRENNFVDIIQKINNLLVWNKNQEIFNSTDNRLLTIGQTIRRLSMLNVLGDEESGKINDLYREAQNNFGAAQDANSLAKQSLNSESPSDSSVNIKRSLEYLAQTYQNFFDLSNAIGTILPR